MKVGAHARAHPVSRIALTHIDPEQTSSGNSHYTPHAKDI